MPVAVTLAGFAADDRSRLNTRIPIFTLIFARGGLYVGARGATGNEAVDVALAAILSIDDRLLPRVVVHHRPLDRKDAPVVIGDRKRVGTGRSGSRGVDLEGRRCRYKKKTETTKKL